MSLLSFFTNLLQSFLQSLGFAKKTGTIVLLGLDNAGKTTFLHKLRTNSLLTFPPTDQPHKESFTAEGVEFSAWDLGGHEAVRHIWEDFVCEASAVLFLVDVADHQRLEEVRDELDALVEEGMLEDGVPLAILLNKADLEGAMRSDYVAEQIWYDQIVETLGVDRVQMFRMSVLRGRGYQDALRWVASFL
jgi:GTP-binding protein SAR1